PVRGGGDRLPAPGPSRLGRPRVLRLAGDGELLVTPDLVAARRLGGLSSRAPRARRGPARDRAAPRDAAPLSAELREPHHDQRRAIPTGRRRGQGPPRVRAAPGAGRVASLAR